MSQLVEQLSLLMSEKGLSRSQVARSIGMSTAAISTFLSGTYQGNLASIEEKIAAFLQLEENRRRDKKLAIEYVRTRSARRAADILRLAHADGQAVVIIGQAGLGKTRSLKDYVANNPDAVLIEADPTFTAKVLLKKLAEKVGAEATGNLNALMEAIVVKLAGSGRLIAVDEAECLPLRALECLRRIHDKTEVGLALVGMPRLLMNLRGRHGELKQLYSRIGFKLDLGDEIDAQELSEIAAKNLKGADTETVSELVDAAAGNTRRLVKLLHGVSRLSKIHNEPVNVEMVKQFREMLIH